MLGYIGSAWSFLIGITRRWFVWAPAILLDPFDLYDRYIKSILPESLHPELRMSPTLGRWVLGTLLFWAAILTYHEKRKNLIEAGLDDPPVFKWGARVDPKRSDNNYAAGMISITHVHGPPAKQCKVQLDKLLLLHTSDPIPRFDPIILKWVWSKAAQGPQAVDIQNGETKMVNICAAPQLIDPSKVSLGVVPGFHLTPASDAYAQMKINYPVGEYLASIRLLGDNILQPCLQSYSITVSTDPNTLVIKKIDAEIS